MTEDSHSPLTPGLVKFAELLARRFERNVFATEDSVRYTLFHALYVSSGLRPEDIVLEQDHSIIARAKVDMWIPSFAGRSYAIEFKYDRAIPSQMNTQRTQKAGHVLKDIFRLARLHADDTTVAIFVYLAAREMTRYMTGHANGLSDLFGLKPGGDLSVNEHFFAGRSNTLRAAAGEIITCSLSVLLSCSLPQEHELRVYRVRA
jgi:hypothetical protein